MDCMTYRVLDQKCPNKVHDSTVFLRKLFYEKCQAHESWNVRKIAIYTTGHEDRSYCGRCLEREEDGTQTGPQVDGASADGTVGGYVQRTASGRTWKDV